MNNWQRRYHGYLKTPILKHLLIPNLIQFELGAPNLLNTVIPSNIRLGHVAEYFYLNDLNCLPEVSRIEKNIQLIEDKTTLGEIDFVIYENQKVIHLEVAYKFYLYLPSGDDEEYKKWIGPNKKDSLDKKINRIKNHQFPLIQKDNIKSILREKFKIDTIHEQQIAFKAQLFIPFKLECLPDYIDVSGYYLTFLELKALDDVKVFIPEKMDWFCIPHSDVSWCSKKQYLEEIEMKLNEQYSPLVWVKQNNGEIFKAFIVWW